MKQLILVTMSVIMFLISGCGSEISVVWPIFQYDPPTISDFIYSQDTVNSYVNGTVDFYAPDHDLDSIIISVRDSRGVEIQSIVTSLGGYSGQSAGTISFSIDYINYQPDSYYFTIYLTDYWGYMSNPVYGSFSV